MFSVNPTCYRYTKAFKPTRLKAALPKGYSIEVKSERAVRGVSLETFDGQLRRCGNILLQVKGRAVLFDLMTGSCMGQRVSMGWKFAADLKGGELGLKLQSISPLRAFLSGAELTVEQCDLAILDELQKTVVRGTFISVGAGKRKAVWISAAPLRGYDADYALFNAALLKNGFAEIQEQADYFPMLGINKALYESKPEIMLDAKAPVFESANMIVATFLRVVRKNEPGIRADIDSEFVHDYRVSLRRIRSLLSLFKGVYAAEACAILQSELADIMKQTNRLRDLDVYLLGRAKYYAMVPESMHGGLDLMFDVFSSERQAALQKVCVLLQSSEYTERMAGLRKAFHGVNPPARGHAAGEGTLHFAKRLILKRYWKITGIAQTIKPDTPDEVVHELRIQCKKLRYLMEFFMPLFPQKKIKPLIKSLKSLQDMLGRFNDYSVQRESLAAFAKEHPMRGKRGIRLAESVGALVATLYQLQLQAREEVEAGLGKFANKKTGRSFTKLFSNKG